MRNFLIYFISIVAYVPFGVGSTLGFGGLKGEGLVLGLVSGLVSGLWGIVSGII